MANVLPRDLSGVPDGEVNPNSAVIVDDGSGVFKSTPAQLVASGFPVASQAEAEAGAVNNKAMTPQRVSQAIDALGVSQAVLASSAGAEMVGFGANTVADLASTDSGKGAALVGFKQNIASADARDMKAKAQEVLSVEDVVLAEDSNAGRRSRLQGAVDGAASRKLAMALSYETSAGTQHTDPNSSDPDPAAVYISTSNQVIDGRGGGTIEVDTPDKSVFHIVNDTEADRVTNTVIRDITLGQPYSTIISAGLTDDYFTLRFEGTEGCGAENVRFLPCELALTFQFSQTVSYSDRASKRNWSRNCFAPSVAFMGLQLFGEQGGVHTGHIFNGVDSDGTSRAAAHGVRLNGFDFAPCIDNIVTDHSVSRFLNGLSLQTYVRRNDISLIARDCQNGCQLPRQADRDSVQMQNRIKVTTYQGDYGIYDQGGRDNEFEVNIVEPAVYGIEAVNSGLKTFVAGTAVNTGTDQITITSHGFATGDAVIITAGVGTLPTGSGISNGAELYVIRDDANTIKLATTQANALAGTQIDITVAGSGTISLYPADYCSGNKYTGKILRPQGVRAANLNSVVRAIVDLDIVGKSPSDTTYGLICSGPYLSGKVQVRDCNAGVFLTGEFANLIVKAHRCTTGLAISGHNNVVFCDVVGNLSVTGNNNTVIGRVTGTVTNSGSGNRIMVKAASAVADLTMAATSGSLPTPNGSVTFADASTPSVTELLEAVVELNAKQVAHAQVLRGAGLMAT